MSQFFAVGECIQVELDAMERPSAFYWNVQRHSVESIADHWRIDEDWWQQRLWRDYYKITTNSGYLLLIYHDLVSGNWYLQRVYD